MSLNKTLKIVLINAPSLGIIEPWEDAPEFGRNSLAYLAGFVRQFPFFEVKIIDAKFEQLSFKEVITIVSGFHADIIAFTAFTNEIKPCAYLAAKLKELQPNLISVIGGAHLTALPIQTLKEFSSFDIGVVGEGEITFIELCKAVREKRDLNSVLGLVLRENEYFKQTPPRERILDQDIIPMPAWDLMPRANVYWIQTQRGCPFKCVFCMNHNGRVARKTGIEKVMDEIEYVIDTFHPEWIRFGDELFTVDINRTMQFLDEFIKRGFGDKVKWDIQTHVNYVNYEMFLKFKEANCTQVDLGVETGDIELLRKMGKGTDIKKIRTAFDSAKKAEVTTGSFFLFGQPNETPKTIISTIKFAVKLNPDIPMFGIMVPYPGTKVAKLAAENKEGFMNLSYDWDQYRKQIGGAVTFASLSRNKLELFQLIGYISVFFFNFRIKDFFKFLYKYREEAVNVFKKIIMLKDSIDHVLKKPQDYDAVLNGNKISSSEMQASFDNFDEYQKRELLRTKKLRPDLLKEQLAVVKESEV